MNIVRYIFLKRHCEDEGPGNLLIINLNPNCSALFFKMNAVVNTKHSQFKNLTIKGVSNA
jgi:hypothetical protein